MGGGGHYHSRRAKRALGPLSYALRAALRAVALSHARLRAGVTRGLSAKLTGGEKRDCPPISPSVFLLRKNPPYLPPLRLSFGQPPLPAGESLALVRGRRGLRAAYPTAIPVYLHFVHLYRIDFPPLPRYNRVIYYGMLFLVQRESNTCRIPAVLFGPFGLIVLALRQQGGVLCDQNPTNIPRWNVLRSFFGADFRPDAALTAENP